MTVKEYQDQVKKELMDKKLERLDARDAIVGKVDPEDRSSDERALATKFYKALASRDPNQFAEVNDLVAKEYKQKDQDIGVIGTGDAGGVLVPTTVADSIVTQMFYISPMRQISTVIADMPAQLQLPSEETLTTAYWVAEGATGTDSGDVFAANMLTPFKMMGLDSFTSEIIADAATNPSIQNFVEKRFAVALALLENQGFANGSGSGQPWGFRSSQITPTVVTQSGDALQYEDMISLKYALATAYRKFAVYLVSSTAAQALEAITDTMGRPIWREGLAEDTPPKLLGRPVYIVDEIPDNLVNNGLDTTEIWQVVPTNYYIGDRGALRVDYGTNGNDFANDKISLRMAKRVAGMPVISNAFAKLSNVYPA